MAVYYSLEDCLIKSTLAHMSYTLLALLPVAFFFQIAVISRL